MKTIGFFDKMHTKRKENQKPIMLENIPYPPPKKKDLWFIINEKHWCSPLKEKFSRKW